MSALAISTLAAHAPISLSTTVATSEDHLDDDIVATFTRLNPNIIALPIGLSDSQHDVVTIAARRVPTTDHLSAFLHTTTFTANSTNILFLDLTPGQTAARHATIDIDDGGKYAITVETTVRSEHATTPENLLSTLVDPIVAQFDDIQRIFVYGANPRHFFSALHTTFPTTTPEPVSLTVISRGAAIAASLLRPPADILSTPLVLLPISLVTANGRCATIVPHFANLPLLRTAHFTNTSDSQTTATLELIHGVRARPSHNIPGKKIVMHGLTPVPKGTARIQVSLAIDLESVGVLTVEQLLADDTVVFTKAVKLPTILKISPEAYSRHVDESEGESNIAVPEDETLALPV